MLFEEAYLSKDVDSCKKNADGEGDIVSSVLYLFMNINNMFYCQPKKLPNLMLQIEPVIIFMLVFISP